MPAIQLIPLWLILLCLSLPPPVRKVECMEPYSIIALIFTNATPTKNSASMIQKGVSCAQNTLTNTHQKIEIVETKLKRRDLPD
jgi:hypothetical protein